MREMIGGEMIGVVVGVVVGVVSHLDKPDVVS